MPKRVPKGAQARHSDCSLPDAECFTTISDKFSKQELFTMGKHLQTSKRRDLSSVFTSQRVAQASLHRHPFYRKDSIPFSLFISSVHITRNNSFICFQKPKKSA